MTNPAAVGDLTQLANNLAAASQGDFINTAAGLIRQAAEAVQQDAKVHAPRKTGALANSITVVFTGPLTAIVGPTKPYGVFQEFGTRGPYKIRPRRATKLAFQVDGKWVFAKEVTHPGLPARPFMRPAAERQLSDLQDNLGQTAVNLIVGNPTSE